MCVYIYNLASVGISNLWICIQNKAFYIPISASKNIHLCPPKGLYSEMKTVLEHTGEQRNNNEKSPSKHLADVCLLCVTAVVVVS